MRQKLVIKLVVTKNVLHKK